MSYQDAMFLPSELCFVPLVKKIYGVEGLRTATCLRTVVDGKQWRASCKILLLHQIFFLC